MYKLFSISRIGHTVPLFYMGCGVKKCSEDTDVYLLVFLYSVVYSCQESLILTVVSKKNQFDCDSARV